MYSIVKSKKFHDTLETLSVKKLPGWLIPRQYEYDAVWNNASVKVSALDYFQVKNYRASITPSSDVRVVPPSW